MLPHQMHAAPARGDMQPISAAAQGSTIPLHAFTPVQIQQLQEQIQRYKALNRQYNELTKRSQEAAVQEVSEQKPTQVPTAPILHPSSSVSTNTHFHSHPPRSFPGHVLPKQVSPQPQPMQVVHNPVKSEPVSVAVSAIKSEVADIDTTDKVATPLPDASPKDRMGDFCMFGLVYAGPQSKSIEQGTLPTPPWLVGPINILPAPYKRPSPVDLLTLKEKLCHDAFVKAADHQPDVARILQLQRRVRSHLGNEIIRLGSTHTSGGDNNTSVKALVSRFEHRRPRKTGKRDTSKMLTKEQRRRVGDREETRRKKHQHFLRAVMSHKENFFKFHKAKRTDCARAARSVKMHLDGLIIAKEKEEDKSERRRLQALKENDMEAYSRLVQETKNKRLQYLLQQTDEYIATISRMISNQREEARQEQEELRAQAMAMRGMGLEGRAVASSSKYYEHTHQRLEEVRQPQILVGGDLKEYQLAGLQWLVSLYNNNLNGILADEMGLGKTIQTISLLAYVMEFKHNNGPFLVVVPLSTLSNWVNEFNKWAPSMLRVVYKGAPAVRKQLFKDEVEPCQFNVLLTTYEYVMKDKAVLKRISWQYIIVDEGHRMKNAQSKFAQTLGSSYTSRHRLLLTGTPLQNSLPELWALLNFLLPDIFNSVDTFDNWFNKPFATFRSGVNNESSDQDVLTTEERMLIINRLHEVLRPFMLRRVKSMVMDQLPEKVEKVLKCELSGWQKSLYKIIQETGMAKVGPDGQATGSGLNNVIMQLRKVCNHPYLFLTEGWMINDDICRSSGKFELLDRMLLKLKAAGHRVLLFSQMTQLMTVLEDFFKLRGLPYLRLDGSTAADDREQRMFMFNDPDSPYFIFLLSTRAGGLGLNLATADTVILFDSDWNPMMDAQAQDRAHRIGQKNEVRVFRLMTASPVEERILSRATDKLNLNGLVVEAGKFNKNSKAQERKEMMETLLKEWDEKEDESENDDANDLLDPEQLNELMATSDEELKLYQQMDMERNKTKLQAWIEHHERLGYNPSAIPPLPSSLLQEGELPSWLSNASTNIALSAAAGFPAKEPTTQTSSSVSPYIHTQSFKDAPAMEASVPQPKFDMDEASLGVLRESRKRKEVNYSDDLTDHQFTKLVEGAREDQTKPQKSKRVAVDDAVIEDMMRVLKDLRLLKDETGRPVARLFAEKPNKRDLPSYYEVILKPISLKEISRKIREKKYATVSQYVEDVELMCRNARTFNHESSQVYQDSNTILNYFKARMSELQLIEPPSKRHCT